MPLEDEIHTINYLLVLQMPLLIRIQRKENVNINKTFLTNA